MLTFYCHVRQTTWKKLFYYFILSHFSLLQHIFFFLVFLLCKYLISDIFVVIFVRYLIVFTIYHPPVTVPIEMKCSTAQQSQIAISNENCNNLNSNTTTANSNNHLVSNSISGIVDSSGILTQINPSPILQQQTNHHIGNSSPSDNNNTHHHHHHHKSPLSGGNTTGSTTITSTPTTNASMTNVICGGCIQPICDRYIMKVVETAYHEKCLQCISCCCNLINTCYQRDNKLFCRKDYER